MKVRRGSSALTTIGAEYSVPSANTTPVALPSLVITWSTGDSSFTVAPNACGRTLQHLGEAAVAALVEAPHTVMAVLLADPRVRGEHRARRARPLLHLRPPVRARPREGDAGEDPVREAVEERLLPGDVVVERHGLDPELAAHAAHAHPREPRRVGDPARGVDDAVGGERWSGHAGSCAWVTYGRKATVSDTRLTGVSLPEVEEWS